MDWIASKVALISSDGVTMRVRNEFMKGSYFDEKGVMSTSGQQLI